MPLSHIVGIDSSLCLIHVPRLTVRVFVPGQAFGNLKRRVQGQFQFNGANYWLWVTDPRVERDYLAMANGEYTMGACYLTISLGEAFNDAVFKLIAAVRPAVAVPRLSLSPSGRVVYTLKTPYRDGTTQVAFEPVDFIARLAALA